MKVLAILLLCGFAAVQGRSAVSVAKSTKELAALGENPWLVHLRIAVSTSGLLNTCAGSLISDRWALTASSCVSDARFIWVRYGVVTVINPSLVTETSAVRLGTTGAALISINRVVHSTANISPVALAGEDTEVPESTSFCAFGDNGADGPGEVLNCWDVTLTEEDDVITASADEDSATEYDIGAPLVSSEVQIGLLVDADGSFLPVSGLLEWIEDETGLNLRSDTKSAA